MREASYDLVRKELGQVMESFHGKLRDECLNASWFQNLFDARRKLAEWKEEYNERRPHSSLGYRTPAEFAAAVRTEEGRGKDARWKTQNGEFPTALANPADGAGFPLSHRPGGDPSSSEELTTNQNRLGGEGSVV